MEATADILGYSNASRREKVRTIEARNLLKLRKTTFARKYITEKLIESTAKEKNTEWGSTSILTKIYANIF